MKFGWQLIGSKYNLFMREYLVKGENNKCHNKTLKIIDDYI